MKQIVCDKCGKAISEDDKEFNNWSKAYLGIRQEIKNLCKVCFMDWTEYTKRFFLPKRKKNIS